MRFWRDVSDQALLCRFDGTREFRVRQQRRSEFRKLRQCGLQVSFRNTGKFRDAAFDQKALEAETSRFPKTAQSPRIPRNHAAPESRVHPQFSCRRFALALECADA